jgi:S-adenosylmethionine hydrolase
VELDNPDVWRTSSPSATFHGRDIFAPAAAHLAAGRSLEELGSPVETLEPLRWAQPFIEGTSVEGWVTHVDHFGNCITNVRRSTLVEAMGLDEDDPPAEAFPPLEVYAGTTVLDTVRSTYGDVAGEDPLLLFGSTGFLEVAVNGGNAAELLDIRKGDSIKISLPESE